MKLSDFFEGAIFEDGVFRQTQFVNTSEAGSLAFVKSPKYLKVALANPNISSLVVPPGVKEELAGGRRLGVYVTENPEKDFYQLHNRLIKEDLVQREFEPYISDQANIADSAIISPKCRIESGVSIEEGAIIGDYSILKVGVHVGAGAIVGAEGHFSKRFDDGFMSVKHAGGVLLKENSQVLAGAIVQKALHADFTEVGECSIVSVGAQIGHGCRIGDRTTITGRVQVAGYTSIGNDVWIGPSATVGNLLEVGDGARIEIGSVVINDVQPNEAVSGNFALPHKKHLRDFMRRNR